MPFCITPHPEKANIFITGCDNKKAVQWDADSGEIVQEDDEHLNNVNTVTFINDNKQIITTSDDKKIFIWDYGIPVVVKYISESHMRPVPAVTISPDGRIWTGQSGDNQIICME